MASIKACWKQKRVLNKAYIRICASGEQWVCALDVKDNPKGREERLYVCVYLNMHQSMIGLHLQGDPCNYVQRVNDVAQRFAHLPPVGVSHHCMQINLWGKKASSLLGHVLLMTLKSCTIVSPLVSPLWRAACLLVWGPSSPYEQPRRTGCHGPSPAMCRGRTHSGPGSEGKPQTAAFITNTEETKHHLKVIFQI